MGLAPGSEKMKNWALSFFTTGWYHDPVSAIRRGKVDHVTPQKVIVVLLTIA